MSPIPLDRAWLTAHPLPDHPEGTDKNSRGRMVAVGGSRLVPGALWLTGEAALRAGAGKIRMATIAEAAIALGVAVPEAAVVALPTDDVGEIAGGAANILTDAIAHCDTLLLGPGMGSRDAAQRLVTALLVRPVDDLTILLDAAAVACAGSCAELLQSWAGRLVLTPHYGEMAALTGREEYEIAANVEGSAIAAARLFGAVIALKGTETVIAAPDGSVLRYRGGGVGLATGGSGDVLAGVIGGLLSRGAPPLVAAGWGVWLHGEAGTALAERIGPIGFLARELLAEVPRLMRGGWTGGWHRTMTR